MCVNAIIESDWKKLKYKCECNLRVRLGQENSICKCNSRVRLEKEPKRKCKCNLSYNKEIVCVNAIIESDWEKLKRKRECNLSERLEQGK